MSIVKLAGALALLAVYPRDHPDVAGNACLVDHYHGTYGGHSIFLPPTSCFLDRGLVVPAAASVLPSYPASAQLVWVEEVALEEHLRPTGPNASFAKIEDRLAELATLVPHRTEEVPVVGTPQAALSTSPHPPDFYHALRRTTRSALLALSPAYANRLSFVIPLHWKLYALPTAPLKLEPVLVDAIARIRTLVDGLEHDERVQSLVDELTTTQLYLDVTWLSGEAPQSPIFSRNSFAAGAQLASEYIRGRMESSGAKCELRTFKEDFAPNVVWCVFVLLHDVSPSET